MLILFIYTYLLLQNKLYLFDFSIMGGHDLCKRILKTITKSISLFNRIFTYVMEHTILPIIQFLMISKLQGIMISLNKCWKREIEL